MSAVNLTTIARTVTKAMQTLWPDGALFVVKETAEGLTVSYLEMYTCYVCSACFELSL